MVEISQSLIVEIKEKKYDRFHKMASLEVRRFSTVDNDGIFAYF